jgi:hypothetical protein
MHACKECRYYHETEGAVHVTRECRRHPPVMLAGSSRAFWPDLDDEEDPWCGEWEMSAEGMEKVRMEHHRRIQAVVDRELAPWTDEEKRCLDEATKLTRR